MATDRQTSQGGRVLETLGYYDPSYEPPRYSLDESRITYWTSTGAQVSPAVAHLVKRFKKAPFRA